ncbi:MAG: hypothetical protein Q9M39_07985 [Sulfurovum sp.]|nr:hypothetical protein [Sulfurovum sp.]
MIDASIISSDDLVKVIRLVNLQKPELFLVDVFHNETFKTLEFDTMFVELPQILFVRPIFMSDKDHINYFDNHNNQIGVYNFNKLYERTSNRGVPYLDYENISSLNLGFNQKNMPKVNQYINYNSNPSFAKLHARDILENNVVSELLTNKIVVLSNIDNHYMMASSYIEEKEVFLHQRHLAFFLKSFMFNEWISEFTIGQYILYMVIFSTLWLLLSIVLFHKYHKYHKINTVFIFVVPSFLYWMAVSYGLIVIPLVEMFFITSLINYSLMHYWQNLKEKSEQNILNRLTLKIREKTFYKTFYNSDTYWLDIISIIRQLVPSNKLIIFEKIDYDTHIKAIASYNCELDEIKELRRDYTREPYATAIKSKSAVTPFRQFFTNNDTFMVETIVPLIYNNNVIGFLAISQDKLEHGSEADMLLLLSRIGQEVSSLLYGRMDFVKRKKKKEYLSKVMDTYINDENMSTFHSSMRIFEKRIALSDTISDLGPSSFISYNLFGNILDLNKKMEDLLKEEDVSAYTLNAPLMLNALADITLIQAQDIIRNVVMNNTEHKQFIYCNKSQKKLLLIVSALTKNDINNKFTESYLFDTYGIIFSFLEFDFIDKLFHFKKNIFDKSLSENKNRIHALEQTINRLDTNILTSIEQEFFINIKNQLHSLYYSYHKFTMLMEQNIEDYQDDLFPINIIENIEYSCQYIRKRLKDKNINFNITSADTLPYVLVSLNKINEYLIYLLYILIEDTEANGVIDIIIEERGEFLNIVLHSNGVGIPSTQFMSYFMYEASIPEGYKELYSIFKLLKSWTGDMYFFSDLSEGIGLHLSLRIVHF